MSDSPARLEDGNTPRQASIHGPRPARNPALYPTDQEVTASKGKLKDKKSWDYIWRSGVAGGFAGCAAKTTIAPLDRVKILFQASNPHFSRYRSNWFGTCAALRDIYLSEGPLGLYKGHSATLLRIFPYAGIKFLAYEQIRHFLIPRKENETPFRRLISGSLAGITSVFFTYPLEVIRVRLAFETKNYGSGNLSAICRKIYFERPASYQTAQTSHVSPGTPLGAVRTFTTSAAAALTPRSGVANFYRGFSSTLLGMVPYAGMSFLTHDTVGDMFRSPSVARYTTLPMKANYPANKPAPLRSWAELTAGGIAGLVSQTASYPLEIIRRRMQVGGAVGDGRRLRIAETAAMIWRERGFRGFFVGLSIGYVKVAPMVAVSFYTYERFKLMLGI